MGEPTYPPVPLDADIEAALERFPASEPIALDGITERRVAMATRFDRSDEELSDGGRFNVQERHVPGWDGAPDVTLLVLTPVAAAERPRPALYYLHGGGMVVGSARTLPDDMLHLARELDAVLASLEYRLAPEHPYPAQIDDAYTGLVWLTDHGADLGVDPDRVIVIGGSAGGNIAASLGFLARDRGGPRIAAQLLNCPMLDHRNNTVSAWQATGNTSLHRDSNDAAWTALLGAQHAAELVSPYASPAEATNFSNLPPTFLDAGSAELFRDEAVAFAGEIWKAGGNAELHIWAGGVHGHHVIVPDAPVSVATRQIQRDWLQRVLRHAPGSSASE